jgi:hypothetical protein
MALPTAIELLRNSPDATLVLLRATGTTTLPGIDPIEAQVAGVGEAESYLEGVAARLRAEGRRVITSVRYSGAAEAIVEAAQNEVRRRRSSGNRPARFTPTTWGTSIDTASPSMAASASMPPTPQPRTPSPFTMVVCESVPTPGREGPWTVHCPSGDAMSIFAAAERYREAATPLVVLAGKEYGAGSSRDWAAKGPRLLGVRAVIAESYERIHRSNLVGMGILPLEFTDGASAASLGLTGRETFAITGLGGGEVRKAAVTAVAESGTAVRFAVRVRIETPREREYLRHGGILPYALRRLLKRHSILRLPSS